VKVAVIPVKVVEGPVYQVVDVIAVRDGGMPAARVVLRSALDGCAGVGPPLVHFEDVLGNAGAAG
jgi:hypothetical protein